MNGPDIVLSREASADEIAVLTAILSRVGARNGNGADLQGDQSAWSSATLPGSVLVPGPAGWLRSTHRQIG